MTIDGSSYVGTPDIVDTIECRIQQRTGGRINPLLVEMTDGRVVVRGMARSFYEKQLVIQAVLEMTARNPTMPIAMDIKVLEREPRP